MTEYTKNHNHPQESFSDESLQPDEDDTFMSGEDESLAVSVDSLADSEHLAAIGTLAVGLGHDLSNMLLPIRLRLASLSKLSLPESGQADIAAIYQSVDQIRFLCNTLRELVTDPEDDCRGPGTVDIVGWWNRVGPLLANALPRQTILQHSFPDDLPAIAITPHCLTQVALDLFMNAGQAAGEYGHVKIWAEAKPDDDHITLGVTDDGPGMTPCTQRRALEPFYTTRTRGLTTGLGLYRVRGLCTAAGGRVEIQSRSGEGTTVTLVLPAVRSHSHQQCEDAVSPGAVISLSDQRMAAYAGALLSSAGFDVRYNTDVDPQREALWVTEVNSNKPDMEKVEVAKDFASYPNHHLIAFGQSENSWQDVEAVFVSPDAGLDTFRSTLRGAITALKG